MGPGLARLYEPVLGRLLEGTRRAVLALAPPRLGGVVLDVGCGSGALLARYATAGCRVVGLDPSPAMLTEARRRLGSAAVLAVGGADALPFSAGAAELVIATMLLHVLGPGERVAALVEMARVAGEKGRVVVADHRPGREPGMGARLARALGGVVEGLAAHGGGVRSLRAAGGAAGLAARAGLVVEAEALAAGGAIAITRLRRIAAPGR